MNTRYVYGLQKRYFNRFSALFSLIYSPEKLPAFLEKREERREKSEEYKKKKPLKATFLFELADYNKCMAYTMNRDAPILKIKGIMAVLGLKHIKIAYDEWKLRVWYHPNISGLYQELTPEEYLYPRNDNDINSQYDAVFTACFLNMCIRNSDIIGMANFAPTVNTRGMIHTYDDGIVLRSTCHVFDAYVNDMEKIMLICGI